MLIFPPYTPSDPVAVPVKCGPTESVTPVSFVPHQLMLSLSLRFLPLPPSSPVPLSRLSPCIPSYLHIIARLMFLKQGYNYVTSMFKYIEWSLAPL